MPLLLGSAASESLQKLFANICGQPWLCGRDIRDRLVYSRVYRGCQERLDIALMRPAVHRCHASDLSALINLVSHGCEEVGLRRK
jgi:hypothetical protein